MNKYLKNIICPFASFLPLRLLISITKQNVIFPLYHLISDFPPPHIKHLYNPVNTIRFIRDMDYFLKHFRLIDPLEISWPVTGKSFSGKPGFLLTFDDGLREVAEIAAPVLRKKGIPAIFFVNNDFIDNKDLFYRYKASILIERMSSRISENCINETGKIFKIHHPDRNKIIKRFLQISYSEKSFLDQAAGIMEVDFKSYLLKHKPYMNNVQLKDLSEKGFLIGAHGYAHQEFNNLDTEEMIRQIRLSVADINNKFSPHIRTFAFPFGDHGIPLKVIKAIHDKDRKIADLSFGTAGFKREKYGNHYQRLPMEIYGSTVSSIVKTEFLYTVFREIFGRNVIARN